ncbi:Thioredoxin-1 [Pseudovibrio axinellae]|uniref:Thioredoxin n=1 Tax=Pseudovibrio axinellae TaxID=989403 RepID=A0A165X303_9HYPH|nr:thioredoxin [Pseudovibrio axinellae]KZL17295.1 Thioredoxin-1 [Pseudovibrio axinellae]SEQ19119.1 thioredoxin [Pseudovibrio axinellae]
MSGSGYSVGGSFGGSLGGGYGGGYQTNSPQPAPTPAPAAKIPAADLVKDTTTQNFMKDVIEGSRDHVVLVDFWAPWCEPCKQLTPTLEKVVKEAGGSVQLVKMNIEEYPEVAGQMGVQSIPAVFAFKGGQPVDGFMGAQTEGEVKKFLEGIGVRIGPSDIDVMLEKADELRDAEGYPEAAQLYGGALSLDAGNVQALSGLAMCYLALGEKEHAQQMLDMVPEDKQTSQHYIAAKTALELAEQAENIDDLAELRARVDANADDHEARFDLALGLNGKGDKTGAVDELIEIIRRDREWNEDGARKQLLQFFEAWGFKDAGAAYGRRKLSSILFS